jgi:two-component system, sensor histidine kinase and response regulator
MLAVPATRGTEKRVSIPVDIAGLDIHDGLSRVAGNRQLYRSLLTRFYTDFKSTADDIRRCIETGDVNEAERRAHNLRGVAGSVGALKVHETATALETALRRGSRSEVPGLLVSLSEELTSVMHGLAVLDTGERPAAPQLGTHALSALPPELLTAMRSATSRGDLDALATLIDSVQPSDRKLAGDLQVLVDNYDYPALRQLLSLS